MMMVLLMIMLMMMNEDKDEETYKYHDLTRMMAASLGSSDDSQDQEHG